MQDLYAKNYHVLINKWRKIYKQMQTFFSIIFMGISWSEIGKKHYTDIGFLQIGHKVNDPSIQIHESSL